MVNDVASASHDANVETKPRLPDSVARLFALDDLVETVPGSTRGIWLKHWIPELIAAGVLVKRGRRFLGRHEQIVNALFMDLAARSDARRPQH